MLWNPFGVIGLSWRGLTDVAQAAAKLRELKPPRKENLYNAACGYGLSAKLAAGWDGRSPFPPPGGKPPELTPEQQTAQKQHLEDALACLRAAIAAGWDDFKHAQQDPDVRLAGPHGVWL